jgi:hypothetical protein
MLVDNSGNPITFHKDTHDAFNITRVNKLIEDYTKLTESEQLLFFHIFLNMTNVPCPKNVGLKNENF